MTNKHEATTLSRQNDNNTVPYRPALNLTFSSKRFIYVDVSD